MSTYYKILPEDLICRGFQYHEGLNIDKNTIDEDECSYGLHFSDLKHILSFYGYGTMIAEVEIPEDAVVYHFYNKSKADRIILKNIRPLWCTETLDDLFLKGAEIAPKNSILFMVVECGYSDAVKCLVEHGANIHAMDDLPLRSASECGYIDVVKYLVEQEANIHVFNDLPLRKASECGYIDIVKYLVEQGANIHVRDDEALCWASENGHLDVVKYLVEQGADIHVQDDDPLYWASTNGYFDIVKYLVEQGANIHALNDYALRIASEYGYLDIVKYLVEQGADIHALRDWSIRCAKTSEIEKYLKSL